MRRPPATFECPHTDKHTALIVMRLGEFQPTEAKICTNEACVMAMVRKCAMNVGGMPGQGLPLTVVLQTPRGSVLRIRAEWMEWREVRMITSNELPGILFALLDAQAPTDQEEPRYERWNEGSNDRA